MKFIVPPHIVRSVALLTSFRFTSPLLIGVAIRFAVQRGGEEADSSASYWRSHPLRSALHREAVWLRQSNAERSGVAHSPAKLANGLHTSHSSLRASLLHFTVKSTGGVCRKPQ
jgi:hypothetical protein